MNELISVVLPIYNGEKYMRESIDSIIAQTYENWELIIIDDCSTDATASIAAEYVERDSRIRYYKNEQNLRLPRSLNRGFSLTKGAYLTWTSDDNLFEPEAFSKLLNSLKENKADFIFTSYDVIDENGKYISTVEIQKDYKDLIIGFNVVGACFLYTRNVYNTVGDYQHGKILVEDFDYWQRIFAKFNVIALDEVLYKYRTHSSSLTGTNSLARVKSAVLECIINNKPIFKKLSLAKRYYYFAGVHSCNLAIGAHKIDFKYRFYKIIYWYPSRLINKLFK